MPCPSCGSDDVHAFMASGKGYDAGCGLVGCLFFGPVGLLFGLLGSTPDRLAFVCASCGSRFLPPGTRTKQVVGGCVSIAVVIIGILMVGSCIASLGRPAGGPAGPGARPAPQAMPGRPQPGPAPDAPAEAETAPMANVAPEPAAEPLPEPALRPAPKPAEKVQVGMTAEEVEAAIGRPAGRSTRHGKEVWSYLDGRTITFSEGSVESIKD